MDYLIGLISFAAAFVFSLGGVGAAVILIPVLISFGIPINIAKPVGLFYNTVSLTGASVSNIRNKRLDFKVGIPIIIFSFLFAIKRNSSKLYLGVSTDASSRRELSIS